MDKKPCPNCRNGLASHFLSTERHPHKCIACGTDCSEHIQTATATANMIESKFAEMRRIMQVYRGLLNLDSETRAALLPRLRRCVEDVAGIEALQTKPRFEPDRGTVYVEE